MRPMCQYHSLYTIYLTALNLGLFWLALGFIALNLGSFETFRICKEKNFEIDINSENIQLSKILSGALIIRRANRDHPKVIP